MRNRGTVKKPGDRHWSTKGLDNTKMTGLRCGRLAFGLLGYRDPRDVAALRPALAGRANFEA